MSKTLSNNTIVRDFLLESEENFEIASEIDAHFWDIKIENAERFVLRLIDYLTMIVPEKLGENWKVISGKEKSETKPISRYFEIELVRKNWNEPTIMVRPMLQFQQPNCNGMIIGVWKWKNTQLPKNNIRETLDKNHRKGKQNRDWWPYYVVPRASDLTRNNEIAREIYFNEKKMIKEITYEFIRVTTIVKELLNEINS